MESTRTPWRFDYETETILFARRLMREHPEIICKVFPVSAKIDPSIALRSCRNIDTAREIILAADMGGLL